MTQSTISDPIAHLMRTGANWPDYYSAGLGQTRDSDCLSRSNFKCALEQLGGETETVFVVRESHWAVGWVEWIAIHESDADALQKADAIQAQLESYPVLNEEDFSREETDEANEVWKNCYDASERVAYIREHRSQFEFDSLADALGCVRGNYFGNKRTSTIQVREHGVIRDAYLLRKQFRFTMGDEDSLRAAYKKARDYVALRKDCPGV